MPRPAPDLSGPGHGGPGTASGPVVERFPRRRPGEHRVVNRVGPSHAKEDCHE